MKTKTFIATAFCFMAAYLNLHGQSWSLTGNTGTNSAINYLGTTDKRALKIKTNDKVRMFITSAGLVSIGGDPPNFKLDVKNGSINTDSVYRINGSIVLSGSGTSFFVGSSRGPNNSGGSLTVVGNNSLLNNTTGYSNTALGYSTMFNNTSGFRNVGIGYQSLYSNTTGSSNTATGSSSLRNNDAGIANTASGSFALYSNTEGDENTADGFNALYENTIGNSNVGHGYSSGSFNDNNTFCSFLGYDADQSVLTDFSNSSALGTTARITGSSQIRLGNAAVSSIGGYAAWTDISDGRYKKNIKENVPGIEFINQLRPVTYTMDVSGIRKFLGEDITGEEGTEGFREMNAESKKLIEEGVKEKEKIIYTGFIAQEVEASAQKLGYDFSGVDKPQNESSLYGLRYSEFVVPLVKAVQELNTELKMQNAELMSEIASLKSEIGNLKSEVRSQTSGIGHTASDLLEQNSPNPFYEKTFIHFNIPVSSQNAELKIYSSDGKELKSFIISTKGKGQIEINANSFSPGTYNYALMIDGKTMDSKQMILTK